MKYIMAAIPGEFDEDCTPVCTPVGLYTLDGFTKFLKETTVKSIKDFRGSGDDIFLNIYCSSWIRILDRLGINMIIGYNFSYRAEKLMVSHQVVVY